jgi:flagellar hook-associated protein 1 FlgK
LEAKQIQQMRDALLDQQVVREVALKSSYEAQQAANQKAQAGLGQSIDRAGESDSTGAAGNGNGLAKSIDDFFNGFQSFAANPTDPGERQNLLQQTGILTDRFQTTDNRLAQLQTDLTTQVAADVIDVNRILQNVADLNGQIGRFEINSPGSAVDLRDQRQAQLEDLAKRISIESRPDPSAAGQIQVFSRDSSGNPVILVNLASVTGPVTVTGSTVKGGSSATALALTGGSIQGDITTRDGSVQNLRTDLNNLAKQLVTSVNAAYNPTSATGNFFLSTGLTAATIAIDPSVTASNLKASDGGPAGDSTIARSVGNLASQVFSTTSGGFINGTFSNAYATTVTRLGQSLDDANNRVQDQTNIEKLVRGQRDSVSGVSMDEEMADLMKYQRAFQASSRVVQVIDELLDQVVNRMGV